MKHSMIILVLVILTSPLMSYARDRALVVGINYYSDSRVPRTEGSVEDAKAIYDLLQSRFSFSPESITLLINEQATTARITLELERIVRETKPGDRVFVHYSGHGYQVPDAPKPEGDELDELDEVITPFDVSARRSQNEKVKWELKAGTYISDDEVNTYIARLSGRSVVMFFDSCNSGTISRSISNEATKYSRYFSIRETSRSISDKDEGKYSYVPPKGASRDLSLVKDQNMGDGNISGAIVISSASAYQEAFSFQLGDSFRGGGTYLFEQSLRNGNPPLKQIRDNLTEGIKDPRFPRQRDGTVQKPEVAVFSSADLWEKPLFGAPIVSSDHPSRISASYTAGLEAALTNQYSKIGVNLTMSWAGKPEENGRKPRIPGRFYLNDEMQYSVETSEEGYLYVFIFSADNVASCVFPAYVEDKRTGKMVEADVDNLVKKGTHHFPRTKEEFPNKVQRPYITYARPPTGTDVWVALISKQKFNFDRQDYSWQDIFDILCLEKVKERVVERTRGAGNKSPVSLSNADWQTSRAIVEVVP